METLAQCPMPSSMKRNKFFMFINFFTDFSYVISVIAGCFYLLLCFAKATISFITNSSILYVIDNILGTSAARLNWNDC